MKAMRDWLPYPVYEFRGGPVDGEYRTVRLYETHRGMAPPPYYRVSGDTTYRLPPPAPGAVSARTVYTVHDYKFIPTTNFNEGYYEYQEDDHSGNRQGLARQKIPRGSLR